jgi:ribosomal protein S18 acetylase RimI-like enzyme
MPNRSLPDDLPADALQRLYPPAAVDDRVTVRYRLDDGSASDVVGWITRLNGRQVWVQSSRSGRETTVARARIILARRIPPAMGGPPPSRTSAAELEQIAKNSWMADAQQLGEWTLRTGDGFTSRANSCLAVGDPGVDMPAAATAICRHYATRQLRPRAQVIRDSPEETGLMRLGWQPESDGSSIMLAIGLVRLIDDHPRDRSVVISEELAPPWWQAFQRYESAPDVARRMLIDVPPVGLAHVNAARDTSAATDSDKVVAIGRGQVSNGWLGLTTFWTDPGYRQRGLAAAIMRELGHWAARLQTRNAYLQVGSANRAAVTAYQRIGFTVHHHYRYLVPPAEF